MATKGKYLKPKNENNANNGTNETNKTKLREFVGNNHGSDININNSMVGSRQKQGTPQKRHKYDPPAKTKEKSVEQNQIETKQSIYAVQYDDEFGYIDTTFEDLPAWTEIIAIPILAIITLMISSSVYNLLEILGLIPTFEGFFNWSLDMLGYLLEIISTIFEWLTAG
jgi:hypothetical protein